MKKITYKNKRKNRRNIFHSGIISLILIIMCSCYFGSFFSSAHDEITVNEIKKEKYYKSIEIEEGDSIWKIASDNMSNEYDSIYEYISEILSINNMNILTADHIQEGDYLTIAYYK